MPTVRIEPSGFAAHLDPGEPILPGLFRCGYAVRKVGCRRGGCGICKLTVTHGSVTYAKVVADSVLTEEERAAGTCLTCRAIPEGDVTLHIDEVDVHEAPKGLLRYLNVSQSGASGQAGRPPQLSHAVPSPAIPPAASTTAATTPAEKE